MLFLDGDCVLVRVGSEEGLDDCLLTPPPPTALPGGLVLRASYITVSGLSELALFSHRFIDWVVPKSCWDIAGNI